MNRSALAHIAKLLGVFVCLAPLVFLSGCVENAQAIREAQAQFSRAATIENRTLLGAEQGVQASTEAATNYRMAASSMQKLIADKGGELRRDNLLCTAMTIEALSWWRLGKNDDALNVASNASSCSDASTPAGSLPARDLALFQSLPGLIRIDQANQKLAQPAQTTAQFDEVMKLLSDADNLLQTARNQVGAGHPLQLYLIQSQLAIVRNWQYAAVRENLTGQRLICETGHARQQTAKLLAELACASLGVPGQDSLQLLNFWELGTGFTFDPTPGRDPKVLSNPPKSVTPDECAHLSVQGGFPDNCQP